MMRKNFSNLNEFAERNGVCTKTVRNFIARGNLAAFKVGRRTMISTEAEAKWLASLKPARIKRPKAEIRS